ncbi:hypothetical protein AGMMS49992_26510 [Clostridia bacterium]|nr:hypothetical protein AGMMS49992_26510 [Clostridia bacterium]
MSNSIFELTRYIERKMQEYGYSEDSLLTARDVFGKIETLHTYYNKADYSPAIVNEYVMALTTYYHCGIKSKHRFLTKTLLTERLTAYAEFGEWKKSTVRRKSQYVLDNYTPSRQDFLL